MFPFRLCCGQVHDKMSSGPFQHQLLYCSPPLYGSHSTPAVTQWISFHRAHLLIDYFVFYDAGKHGLRRAGARSSLGCLEAGWDGAAQGLDLVIPRLHGGRLRWGCVGQYCGVGATFLWPEWSSACLSGAVR